jgi:hypothetical protein
MYRKLKTSLWDQTTDFVPSIELECAPVFSPLLTLNDGRFIAQTVGRWLPTAAARFRVWNGVHSAS